MIDFNIDPAIRQCYCCHRTHMRRTIRINYKNVCMNLGATCAGKWFGCNTSGNIHLSIDRLKRVAAKMDSDAINKKIVAIIANRTEIDDAARS